MYLDIQTSRQSSLVLSKIWL